jgi:predicted SAM-dependent methyltransferase
MAILNLGCGNRIIEGAVNHDRTKHRPEVAIAHDLNSLPWPWRDSSFDEIQLISVVEHLRLDLVETLDECWRILKPGGRLILKYPLWTALTAHDDPTHRWWWSERVLEVFDPDQKYGTDHPYYTTRKWKIEALGVIKDRNVKAVLTPRKK